MKKVVFRSQSLCSIVQAWWKEKMLGWMKTRRGGEEGKRKQNERTWEEMK